jgi:hypothetical protein
MKAQCMNPASIHDPIVLVPVSPIDTIGNAVEGLPLDCTQRVLKSAAILHGIEIT